MSFFMLHLRIFSFSSPLFSQQKAFSEITFNIFSFYYFFTHKTESEIALPMKVASSNQLSRSPFVHPVLNPSSLTPHAFTPLSLKKSFSLSLGLGDAKREGEVDMKHEFRFSSHHPQHQIPLILLHTDVLIWRLERTKRERLHENGHVGVLQVWRLSSMSLLFARKLLRLRKIISLGQS